MDHSLSSTGASIRFENWGMWVLVLKLVGHGYWIENGGHGS